MRPYRWQDPAPAAVQNIRYRRHGRASRGSCAADYASVGQPETIALPVRDMSQPAAEFIEVDNSAAFAPAVPTMVIEGVEYVEAPETDKRCTGCAFSSDAKACSVRYWPARDTFGGGCDSRRVIYIRKA